MEAGVGSLKALLLSQRLCATTGLALSPVLLFEHPTPRAIGAHAAELLGGDSEPRAGPAAAAAGGVGGGAPSPEVAGGAGRWPGGCAAAPQLPRLLASCGDGVGAVPASRWAPDDAARMSSLGEERPRSTRHGGFVCGAARFDAAFFGVSPAEAAGMDLQQRLLLELGYEALHGAGDASHRRAVLQGADAGVFLGIERPDGALRRSSARADPGPRARGHRGHGLHRWRAPLLRARAARPLCERRHGLLVGARRGAPRSGGDGASEVPTLSSPPPASSCTRTSR